MTNKSHSLTSPPIRAFIMAHRHEDPAKLALKPMPEADWPRTEILNQIASRQKLEKKWPDWAADENLILPAPNVVEQCSGRATATYKAALVSGRTFADLTAGAGADTLAFAARFQSGIAVECDPGTAQALAHNIPHLTQTPINVREGKAEDLLQSLPFCDLIYLDPQRRSEQRKGIFTLKDTAPSVPEMLAALLDKAQTILLKTSPMLDIEAACRSLKGHVHEVHIVEVAGDCKEVLYLLTRTQKTPKITAVSLKNDGTPLWTETRDVSVPEPTYSAPQAFLFEPAPALRKGDFLKTLADKYDLSALHPQTNLLTSTEDRPDFPGRRFKIIKTCPPDRKALKRLLPGGKASLTLRNFPGTTDALRQKLKLKDGGNVYVFACTLADGGHSLLICKKF